MKKLLLSMVVLYLGLVFATAQTNQVPLSKIKGIAENTAKNLWGNVSADDAIPLYSKDDKIVAYRFNFSFNKPFPDKKSLINSCKTFYENGDKKSQWGIGEYGHIMVAARKDMDVIQSYSDVLSPEFAEGFKMIDLAKKALGANVTLKKVYYINFENQWFCYTNGTDDIYVRIFPVKEAVNAQEFHNRVDDMKFFCETGDFSDVWNQYLSGNVISGKSQVWIPNHDGYCKFYDWSYGCTPTAAAMLVSWWDFNSINTVSNYAKLIDYHFHRWDGIQGETDYQVPNAQKQLAIAMNTDTVPGSPNAGSTYRDDIVPGYQSFLNSTNGYNFTCTDWGNHSASWNFSKIQSEIGTYNRPLHISIPNHSECCVAYDVSAGEIGVHNTWWGSVEWRTYTDVERVYTFAGGGSSGAAVNLVSPLGDTFYNHNGSGETYYAGDVMEIKWDYDYYSGSFVKLFYSTNGGNSWSYITSNTPNDGTYDWVIPSGINSSSCRIYVGSYYGSGSTLLGSDGSFGNFKIYSGGSLATLGSDVRVNTSTAPDYYQFINSYTTWCAVGVRNNTSGADWDIKLYDDNSFSNVIASSTYGGSTVDFVVMDGHHSPSQYRGIKVERYSGTGMASVEYEDYTETLSLGDNYDSWPAGDVVEIYDIYLQPGTYGFTLDVTSGSANLDFALYGSTGSAYYAGRSSYLALSNSGGSGGDEYFTFTVTTADYYGVCVWANDANSASYNLKVEKAGTWTGAVNNQWHVSGNWSAGIIPDATIDVTIPNVTNKCWIADSDAECKSLTLEAGTGNYLRIYDETLHIYGDLEINAELKMDNSSGVLIVDGDVFWKSGSTANITAYYATMEVYGDWNFESGSNVNMTSGFVDFMGTGDSWIRSYQANSAFNNLRIYKSGGAKAAFSNLSTADLSVNNLLYITTNGILQNWFMNDNLHLKGYFNYYGSFDFTKGTTAVIFDGSSQMIAKYNNGSGVFGDVEINSSGTVALGDENMIIKGNLTINSGTFDAQGNTISIEGNWTNNVGDAGFDETDSKVIFNGGNYHQYCSSETFDTLEVAKASGGAFRMNGTDVVCEHYDWTAGAVDVLSGSFTAYDLIDNGIYGAFYLNPGGTINLTNNDGFVDLNGDLHIYGGTMNVYGGTSDSYWPWNNDATIEMSDGVLDFHDKGIYVYSTASYSLTENITGGVIRTSRGYRGYRADFTPTAGTFEFYGSSDYYIRQQNGSTLYDVEINKSTKEGSSSPIAVTDGRSKEVLSPGTKSNTITLGTDFTVTHDLTITSGELKLGGYALNVSENVDVYGTLTMDNSSDVLTCGQSYFDQLRFFSGSTGNLSNGTVNAYGWVVPRAGCNFTASTSNTIYFKGTSGGGPSNFEPTAVYGNIIFDKNTGETAYLDNSATQPIVVNGDVTVNAGNTLKMQNNTMIVHGIMTDNSTSVVYVYDAKSDNGKEAEYSGTGGQGAKAKGGTLELDNDFTLNGTMDLGTDGNVLAHGHFNTASGSTLTITGGSLVCDVVSGTSNYYGTYNLSDGLIEYTSSHIGFRGTPNITGGVIRAGRTVFANDNGLQCNGGTFEFIGSSTGNYIQLGANNYLNDFLFNRTGNYVIYPQNTANPFVIKGDVTINSGVFSSNGNDIFVEGDWTNNAGPSAFNETTATVIFNGANNADIKTDETFYNLDLNKTYSAYDGLELAAGITVNVGNDFYADDGTLEMNTNSTLNVTRDIHIYDGAGLNAYNDTGLEIYIGGDFTDDNTSYNTMKGYTPGTEIITFNGTVSQAVTTAAPNAEFGNLVIDKAGGDFNPHNNIYVHGDFTLNSGDWSDNVNGLSHSFEEDFIVNGGTFSQSPNKNTVNFISDKDATIYFAATPANGIFNIVNIDKSATKSSGGKEVNKYMEKAVNQSGNSEAKSQTVTLTSNIFCGLNGGVSVQNGTLDLNGYMFTSTGDLNINNGGILYAGAGSTLRIDQSNVLNINSGGQLSLMGTAGNNVLVTHYNPNFYKFNVQNGGTLSAEFTTFEYMDWYGVYLMSGSTLDPAHALDYCTFQNVQPVNYASSITFNNDQTITCTGVNFIDNPYYNVYKDNNAGDVTFAAATGDYAGAEYEYDPDGRVHWSDVDVNLDLLVILEGAYNGVDMNTDLNVLGLIPLNQPFDSNPSADWYYTGTESVAAIPANVVDWVLVQIRDASNAGAANGGTVLAQQAAFLLSDGSIVDLDGVSNLTFTGLNYSSGLFPVVWHRNHLGVISANKMVRTGGIYTYDFTAAGSAYSNTSPGEKDLGGGVYGMFSGDASGGGIISNYDWGVWKANAGEQGYNSSDFNLNGQVDNVDKNDYWLYNAGNSSQIPEPKNNDN